MNGIQPVAVHFIGADRDDLTCLRDVEQGGVFALEAIILVLNESQAYIETAGHSRRSQRLPVPGHQSGPTRQLAFRRAHDGDGCVAIVRGRRGGRDRRADPLSDIPGNRHHRVFGEWWHTGGRAGDGGERKPRPSSTIALGSGSRSRRSNASGYGRHTVLRFTEGPEVTIELVNPAADLPSLGVSEASGGPIVAEIGTRLPSSPDPRTDHGVAAENMTCPGLNKENAGDTPRHELRR